MSELQTAGIDTNFNAQDAQKVFEAQMRLNEAKIQSRPLLGSWAQTFRSIFGRIQDEPTITAVLPDNLKSSPEAEVQRHLLGIRDNYELLTADPLRERITGKAHADGSYINLTDTEVAAVIPSYMQLVDNLTASPDSAHLLEEGKNGKLTLTTDAKAMATNLIDTFHAQTIDSSEYDLQSLFGHQLKLMYQGLKHDENSQNIDMSVVHRIFSSARMQFTRRMEVLETARREQESITASSIALEAPRKPRFELARKVIGSTIGIGLLGLAAFGFAERQANSLPTRAQAAEASTATHTPISISPTRTTEVVATATLDPAYVLADVAPARTGGDAPSLLSAEAAKNNDSFDIRFFPGTDHEEVKTAYFEEIFPTWEAFRAYVEHHEATSENKRFQPQTIDGLLDVPVGDPENNSHVILGHAKDGSQKGPFEPIQRGFLEGWLKEGSEMPFTFPDGSTKLVRIMNIQRIAGKDPSGIHYASPTYYPTWFDDKDQYIGITCLQDTSGDGETDEYVRFNMEIDENLEVLDGYGITLVAPKGVFSYSH